jgi:hypothetical protein
MTFTSWHSHWMGLTCMTNRILRKWCILVRWGKEPTSMLREHSRSPPESQGLMSTATWVCHLGIGSGSSSTSQVSKWLQTWLTSFLRYWDLNSGPTPWATPPASFLWRVFFKIVCPGWLRTTILLISASWVARITGVRDSEPMGLAESFPNLDVGNGKAKYVLF